MSDEMPPADTQPSAAERLLEKLKRFADGLDDDEKAMLAALLAPGIAKAHADDDEVEGFGLVEWLPRRLPEALDDAIRGRRVRIEGP
jgi:hypothetical protein